jgi:hypothetical protein
VLTVTNRRLLIFESCGNSNWCTPCRRKPDQYVTCFSRSIHVWSQSYILHDPRRQSFASLHEVKQTPTPERILRDQRQTDPVVTLGHIILPPSRQTWSSEERFQSNGYTNTSVYWAHISSCDFFMREVSNILYMIYSNALSSSSETSSAMKDLQSKLDAVSAECLAEKEKVITLLETVTTIQLMFTI